MVRMDPAKAVDIDALKAQIDAEIEARLLVEADFASHIHRRSFRVGDLNLLMGMETISEVVELPQLYRLPGAPTGVKGLANRYGRVVPVVDLGVVFGFKSGSTAKQWLLVSGKGDEAVGLIVDSLPERKKFTIDDEVTLTKVAHPIAAFAKAAYIEWQDTWIDLDEGALFAKLFHSNINQHDSA